MSKLYDKRGIPIERGDVLKVYHFTAALRRKRHYMYKQALDTVMMEQAKPEPFMKFSHLSLSDTEYYWEQRGGQVLQHYEIIQSIDCKFEDRPRRTLPPIAPQ